MFSSRLTSNFYAIVALVSVASFLFCLPFVDRDFFTVLIWPPLGLVVGLFFLDMKKFFSVSLFIATISSFGLSLLFFDHMQKVVFFTFCLTLVTLFSSYVSSRAMRRFFPTTIPLYNVKQFYKYLLVGPLIGGVVFTVCANGIIFSFDYLPVSKSFYILVHNFIGSFLGILVFSPILFSFLMKEDVRKDRRIYHNVSIGIITLLALYVVMETRTVTKTQMSSEEEEVAGDLKNIIGDKIELMNQCRLAVSPKLQFIELSNIFS